jgi:hypothetical protein
MTLRRMDFRVVGTFVAILVAATAHLGVSDNSALAAKPDADSHRVVELFAAMDAGEVEVRFIPRDATRANVLIRNKTDRPLKIQLPAAFAGVPVNAQMGMGGMGMGGGMGGMGGGMGGMGGMGGGMGGMGGGQAMGGGMGGGMMGGMGGGMMGGMGGGMGMGGMMNVAPEKVGKVKVNTVCLEHGKPDPKPSMAYTIRPITAFTTDPALIEVCKMVGRGEIPQNAAQAATWHLTDEMSWQELATKDRVRLMNGYTEKFFSLTELHLANRILGVAGQRAAVMQQMEKESELSPGDSLSNR